MFVRNWVMLEEEFALAVSNRSSHILGGPMKEVACNCAIARFRPCSETGEFVNVGIVLFCPQAETAAELDALLPAILDKSFKGEL